MPRTNEELERFDALFSGGRTSVKVSELRAALNSGSTHTSGGAVDLPVVTRNAIRASMGMEAVPKQVDRRIVDAKPEDTLKTLTKARRAGKIENGSVVRFTNGGFTYAAIYVAAKWWVTGAGRWYGGKTSFTHEDFTRDILSVCETFELASAWKDLG